MLNLLYFKSFIKTLFDSKNFYLGSLYIARSIWDIIVEFEKIQNKKYLRIYKEKQLELDREKEIHSPELYAVWNLKHYFLYKIAQKNPYNSEFFIFTDSGAWRGKELSNWPDIEISKTIANTIGDRILYGQVGEPNIPFYSMERDIIQGNDILAREEFRPEKNSMQNIKYYASFVRSRCD